MNQATNELWIIYNHLTNIRESALGHGRLISDLAGAIPENWIYRRAQDTADYISGIGRKVEGIKTTIEQVQRQIATDIRYLNELEKTIEE